MIRLGHGEATANRACDQRGEPLLLLGGRGELTEDFHVARVGRLGVENVVAERASAELFADQGIFDTVEAHPSDIHGNVRSPQTHLLDLLPDFVKARDEAARTASTRAPARGG